MEEAHKDRRRFKRILLTKDDEITGNLIPSAREAKSLKGYILNISQEGLHFSSKIDDSFKINKGDKFILSEIKGPDNFRIILNLDVEIKWVLGTSTLEYVGCGVQFINMSENTREQINRFLEMWTTKKGETE